MEDRKQLPELELPEGYRLDPVSDPDAPALRRPNGTVVARFSIRGLDTKAIEQEALEDMLGFRIKPQDGPYVLRFRTD